MSPIVLMTDFGTKDGNVGVMKGVIAGIAPGVPILDLSHGIQPQNIREAALILSRTFRYFPEGTIFIVVVDPGVGSKRRALAARIGTYRFVLPDNGILTPILEIAQENQLTSEIREITNTGLFIHPVSNVFHGRDIFAPVGANLAAGVDLNQCGPLVADPVLILLPTPTIQEDGISGEIIHIDHFGNLSTNILRKHLPTDPKLLVHLRTQVIPGLYNTFADRPDGELIALLGSTDYLIISEVNGNAALALGAKIGDEVWVEFIS